MFAGAAIGGYLFPLAGEGSLPIVLIVCAVISAIGAILSEYFIEIDDDSDDEYKAIPNGADIFDVEQRDKLTVRS